MRSRRKNSDYWLEILIKTTFSLPHVRRTAARSLRPLTFNSKCIKSDVFYFLMLLLLLLLSLLLLLFFKVRFWMTTLSAGVIGSCFNFAHYWVKQGGKCAFVLSFHFYVKEIWDSKQVAGSFNVLTGWRVVKYIWNSYLSCGCR